MTMLSSLSASAFAAGLLGGVHCTAMCGGIVAGLSGGSRGAPIQLMFNAGRITSYAVAGGIAGTLGGLALLSRHALPIQTLFYVLANVLLIGVGLYLAGWSGLVTWLERPGQRLWRQLQPLIRRVLPIKDARSAFGLGAIWGWVPCGLVYSVLATALLAGSPAEGSIVMLAFGLGTLPNLLITGVLLTKARGWVGGRALRWTAGTLVITLGLVGLAKALAHSPLRVQDLFCFS